MQAIQGACVTVNSGQIQQVHVWFAICFGLLLFSLISEEFVRSGTCMHTIVHSNTRSSACELEVVICVWCWFFQNDLYLSQQVKHSGVLSSEDRSEVTCAITQEHAYADTHTHTQYIHKPIYFVVFLPFTSIVSAQNPDWQLENTSNIK